LSWIEKPSDEAKVDALISDFHLSRTVATILARIDLPNSKSVKRYLNPKLTHLQSPFLISNMEGAIERIIKAVDTGEKLFVLGDYDVDGVTSTALFVSVLRQLGLDPTFTVPKRSADGVGLNLTIVNEQVLGEDVDFSLVVALDCGSNDHESIECLAKSGVDAVVVDHHQIRAELPETAIVVNPHIDPSTSDDAKMLCTVALVFKLLHGLLMRLRSRGYSIADNVSLKDYLDLVSLGTVTDLVPLAGENRILVRHGLYRISKSKNMGLQALMDVCSLPYGKEIDVSDVSYKLGPRLNAGGRMADAKTSINLLLSNEFGECVKLAHELDGLNQDRQSTERLIYEQATSYLSRRSPRHAIFLYDSHWHTGVVGIVCSRLARQYQIPVVVLGSEGNFAKGSVRSIEAVNLISVLEHCDPYLESWGGHPMAAGLSVRPENIEAFRMAFTEAVSLQLDRSDRMDLNNEKIEIDATLEASDVSFDFIKGLRSLGPFGVSNPDPVLSMKQAQLASKVTRFGTDNFKFWVSLKDADYDLMCIGWGFPSRIPEGRYPLDLVFNLKWHEWKGRGYPQATLIDWRYAF
jgi:single-stranded-DNA-specific exonuclease